MHALKFRWVKNHKGQYVDGHERDDVVRYRQEVFLPAWYQMEGRMRAWTGDNMDDLEEVVDLINQTGKRLVVWFHDESVFYAHDRRPSQWVADGASPTPYAKGEGASMMVTDFVSADYGWLRSKDGLVSARVIFRPGKNRDGYFTNEEILAQLSKAMTILKRDYPDEDHVFVFDNATTHLKLFFLFFYFFIFIYLILVYSPFLSSSIYQVIISVSLPLSIEITRLLSCTISFCSDFPTIQPPVTGRHVLVFIYR
jgi:hypothetical protein